MIAAEEADTARLAAPTQTDPVLLVLPGRQMDCPSPYEESAGEPCPEPILLLDIGSKPRVDTALLREMLGRNPHLAKCLADPTETPNHPHPLAGVNAYKHRLHALRCENVNLRLRVHDLETQLSRMRATRGWQLLERYRRWRRIVFGWLHR
jgi:hypothetical protein